MQKGLISCLKRRWTAKTLLLLAAQVTMASIQMSRFLPFELQRLTAPDEALIWVSEGEPLAAFNNSLSMEADLPTTDSVTHGLAKRSASLFRWRHLESNVD